MELDQDQLKIILAALRYTAVPVTATNPVEGWKYAEVGDLVEDELLKGDTEHVYQDL